LDATLEKLIQLQKTDEVIQSLKVKSESIPDDIAGLDAKLNESRATVEKIKNKIKENELCIRKNESSIEECRQQQGKYRGQLFKLKSNREYLALKTEIDLLDGKISGYETEIIEMLEDTDTQKENLVKSEGELKEKTKTLNQEKNELSKVLEKVNTELIQSDSLQKKLESQIPEETLGKYQRISAKRGSGVSEIKTGNCGGCYMKVRPQISAMVRANDQLINCEKCHRFLYWSDVSE